MSRDHIYLLFLQMLLSVALTAGFSPAQAKVLRSEQGACASEAATPVYVWADPQVRPRAMVLAIHGLAMHGTMFDAFARHLAARKVLVAAPDLRGYGKWHQHDEHCTAAYRESERDIVRIATQLRESNPDIPLFLAGESLGGTVALRIAASNPDLIDGLILSAPAVRHHHRVGLRTIAQVARLAVNPRRKIDVSNYIGNYFSEDETISREGLSDPLVRKQLTIGELVSSCRFMANAAHSIERIPVDMPVLVMQGREDQMVKASSVKLLESKLRSTKRTVCWFENRGHILLETAHVKQDTLDTVSSWLNNNCRMRTVSTSPTVAVAH